VEVDIDHPIENLLGAQEVAHQDQAERGVREVQEVQADLEVQVVELLPK
jgi:hypothetical protein